MTKIDVMEFAYGEAPRNAEYYDPSTHEKEVKTETYDPELAKIDGQLYGDFQKKLEVLNTYLALTENPADMSDESRRTVTFAKLSYGLRRSGEALAWITYHQKVAYATRKEAEGLAALEEFGDYLNKKKEKDDKVKATNDMRDYYVQISPKVLMANKREALVNAMYEHISTIRVQFIQSISTLRSLAYGVKDSNYMSSASVNIEGR